MTDIATFKGIYLTEKGDVVCLTMSDIYVPTGEQSLVRVQYSGVNPGDTRHYHIGMHSFIMGYEFVGEIVAAGPLSIFKPGDMVMGMTTPGHRRPLHMGAHQAYLLAENYMTWNKPDDLDPTIAVGMPAAAQTAMDALFNCLGFGLPSARLDGDDAAGKAILIWGGGSNVGAAAVQLAREAGFEMIIVTASESNHTALTSLGATHCFDYHNASVVEDIRRAVQASGHTLTVAFDAVCSGLGIYEGLSETAMAAVEAEYSRSTPALARQCLSTTESPSDLRLSCVLPVNKDSDWKFALVPRGSLGDSAPKAWAERTERVMRWLISNHKAVWKPMPNITIVDSAEKGVDAIERVWQGKVSMEKVVLKHPLL